MPARLALLGKDGRRIERRAIGEALLLGRDADVDWVLDHPHVSRRHLRVEREGSRYVLVDLGTPNGTSLNGNPLRGRAVLHEGDRIEVADAAVLRFEPGAGGIRPALRITAAVVVACVLGWVAYHAFAPDEASPEMLQARRLAVEGAALGRSGDAVRAKARLKSAVGVLYKAGALDDVERENVIEVALDRIGRAEEPRLDLVALYGELEAQVVPLPESQSPPCRLGEADSTDLRACLRQNTIWLLVKLRQSDTDPPEAFLDQIGRVLRHENGFLRRSLVRREQYADELGRVLESRYMPALLHYVALIESGYITDARSHAGAVGMWQFMPQTARDYGLKVGDGKDERRDVDRSTDAAAAYLQDLAFEFGADALFLALAGYNYGQGRVRSALKRLDDPFNDRSYWTLVERDLLPDETAQYVARYVAAALAGESGLPDAEALAAAGY